MHKVIHSCLAYLFIFPENIAILLIESEVLMT